jgi:hypothetical protein
MITINEIIEVVTISVGSDEVVNIAVTEVVNPVTIQISDVGLQGIQGIQGKDGVAEIKIYQEVPTGLINGINATFISLFNFQAGTVEVFINGIFQKIVQDFNTIGNNTITVTNAPNNGENILINYIKL